LQKVKTIVTQGILDSLVPTRLFSRLTITSKMLLGYMLLVLLTVSVVAYALYSLQRINNLNRSIVRGDILVEEAADKMQDALFAQDMFEKRYLILKSSDMRSLFFKRGDEFDNQLLSFQRLPGIDPRVATAIKELHAQYNQLFLREVTLVHAGDINQASQVSNGELKDLQDKLIDLLRKISVSAKESQDRKMTQISITGDAAFITTAMLCVLSIVLGAMAGLVVTHHIASSIHRLKVGTEHVAEGNFDFDPGIQTKDEIGALSQSFIAMGKRLRQLEEMYLDASPLTRLPGGIAIENVLKKRIESTNPIAFCVLDLDNFKAFNDRYGYANGSEVIKATAHIIENAVKQKGTPDDFIGHVGGDDFVVITTPEYMRAVSEDIIANFDRRIPEFYDPGDRVRGYIRGKTRQGVEMDFPIMTISIAIVTNERRKLRNPLETSEIAAELKDYAKTIPKSVFVVDKRRSL
jgi:GGDEF domain-containing protein/CHASE3 domain sensor protein